MMEAIDALPDLRTYGEPNLGLFIYGSETLDTFKIYGGMLARGWFSGVVTEPRAIHQMLSPAHAQVVDEYLEDLAAATDEVRQGKASDAPVSARYS
jgi:hypothetical protein